MSKKNDGGPAFPIPGLQNDADFNGMTLRDYFAARVAAGDACAEGGWGIVATEAQIMQRATLYYRIADAMLTERAK